MARAEEVTHEGDLRAVRWKVSIHTSVSRVGAARLAELYALDMLDRFRRRTGDNPVPLHWVLGRFSAALVGAEHGIDPTTGAAASSTSWPPASVSPTSSASTAPSPSGGPNGAAPTNGAKWSTPDGFGMWTDHGSSLPFLYEHDNDAERHSPVRQARRRHSPGRRSGPPLRGC